MQIRLQNRLQNQQKVCCLLITYQSVFDDNLLIVRESEAKLAEETAALKEKEEKLLEIKLKVSN